MSDGEALITSSNGGGGKKPFTRKDKRRLKCNICLIIIGIVFVGFGIGVPPLVKYFMDQEFRNRLVVDGPNSSNLGTFKTARLFQVPMYNSFYFFHIENMEEFVAGGKANLTQVGPFVYREYKERFNITFPSVPRNNGSDSPEDQAIHFKEWRYYKFDKEMSCDTCDPDMNITTLNLPLLVVLGQIRSKVPWAMRENFWLDLGTVFLGALSNEPLVFTKTANELIWGYDDPLIELLAPFAKGAPKRYPGLMQNTTSEAAVQYWTEWKSGSPDINQIKQYVLWRNVSELTVWNSEKANQVIGTDGTQFHPYIEEDELHTVFVDVLHRWVPCQYASKTKVRGIDLWRLELPLWALANATERPENAEWFANGPSGVFNLSSAMYKAPIYASKPAFLDADPVYRTKVNMMEPDRALHDTHIDVEPNSGTAMNARQRLQVMVDVTPMMGTYGQVARAMVPVTWIEQRSEITEGLAKGIAFELDVAIYSRDIARFGGLILGTLFIVTGTIVILLIYRKRQRQARENSKHTSHALDYSSINYRDQAKEDRNFSGA